MKVKIKFKAFKDTPIVQTLGKLYNYPKFPPKTAYWVSRIAEKMEKESNYVQEAWMKLIKEHALLDEKGEFVPLEHDGQKQLGTYQIPEDRQEAFKKAAEIFGETEAEIELNSKLSFAMFENTGIELTPRELSALDPLLNTLEAVAGQEAATGT